MVGATSSKCLMALSTFLLIAYGFSQTINTVEILEIQDDTEDDEFLDSLAFPVVANLVLSILMTRDINGNPVNTTSLTSPLTAIRPSDLLTLTTLSLLSATAGLALFGFLIMMDVMRRIMQQNMQMETDSPTTTTAANTTSTAFSITTTPSITTTGRGMEPGRRRKRQAHDYKK